MKIPKQLRKVVEQAVKNSAEDGKIMENQVKKYVTAFKKLSRSEAVAALSLYLKGIKRILGQHTLVVESAEKPSFHQVQMIKKTLNTKYIIHNTKLQLNPSLLGGIRVKIGDTIFEDSIRSRINQIKGVIKNA